MKEPFLMKISTIFLFLLSGLLLLCMANRPANAEEPEQEIAALTPYGTAEKENSISSGSVILSNPREFIGKLFDKFMYAAIGTAAMFLMLLTISIPAIQGTMNPYRDEIDSKMQEYKKHIDAEAYAKRKMLPLPPPFQITKEEGILINAAARITAARSQAIIITFGILYVML